MTYINLTPGQIDKIAEAVARKIMAAAAIRAAPDKFFSTEEACDFLGMKKNTLYKKIHDPCNPIPCMKNGKRLVFSQASLQEWICR